MPQHAARHAAPRGRKGPAPADHGTSLAAGATGRHRRQRTAEPTTRFPSLATTAIAVTAVTAAVVAGPQLAQRAESANATGEAKTASPHPPITGAAKTPAAVKATIKAPRKDIAAPKDAAVTGDESVKLTSATLRRIAAEKASRSRARQALTGDPKSIAASLLPSFGIGQDQMQCLITLWTHESNWRVHATNPSSGAYGIPQALPAGKMAKFGGDWQTNATTQIKWGLWYIKSRYGSPCSAWSFWQRNNWY